MIATCLSCQKKYKINDDLIPKKGRLVQCPNCKNKWIVQHQNKEEETLNNNEYKTNDTNTNETKKINKIVDNDEKNLETTKNETSFFNLLLVFFISIIALFLVLDTFKYQISLKWKNFDLYIDNIYEIFEYMLILIKDLFKSY